MTAARILRLYRRRLWRREPDVGILLPSGGRRGRGRPAPLRHVICARSCRAGRSYASWFWIFLSGRRPELKGAVAVDPGNAAAESSPA